MLPNCDSDRPAASRNCDAAQVHDDIRRPRHNINPRRQETPLEQGTARRPRRMSQPMRESGPDICRSKGTERLRPRVLAVYRAWFAALTRSATLLKRVSLPCVAQPMEIVSVA